MPSNLHYGIHAKQRPMNQYVIIVSNSVISREISLLTQEKPLMWKKKKKSMKFTVAGQCWYYIAKYTV